MKKTGLAHRIVHSRTSRVLLFSSLAVFIVLSSWFYRKLNQSQKQRYLSYVTADELRQSSDDLTRMVRTYVMTKNPRYEQMYWDILGIRNGQKARPLRYENIYWDFMASTNTKPRPDGQKISLFEMMTDLGFTPEELAKLTQAETYSNDLVRIEEIAMHAMKGEFLDAEGKFTVKKEPDYDYARTILYDESYHKEKVDIMTPIDEFFVMVNSRTEAKVNRDTICTYVCISLVFATILLLLGMSKVELSTRKRSEERLEAINACLSNLGSDFAVNADRITTVLGETLGATCSLYNRLDHGMLCSLGQWQTPPDYNPQDRPDGHICYDVIQRNDDEVCTVRNLQNSPYAQSDANVLAYNLETYVGQVVTCNGEPVGALCAVFQKDFNPSEDERRIMGILTSAIRGEEERRQAEETLKKHQHYLEKAQEIGRIGTWELDLPRNSLRWTDENYRVFGVPLGTALNYEIFLNCVHPDDRNYVHETWSAALNHEPYDIEHRLIVDGKVKWVREQADITFDENGKAVKGIGVTQDITKRKRDELALKYAKEQAEAANQAKSQFLANMSHEIRTPMNAIIGFSDILVEEDLTKEQKIDVDIIRGSATNLLKLINDILDCSKIEAGQLDVETIDCSLGKQLNSIDSMMKAQAQEKALDFKIMATKDVPAHIRSDPYRLQQCLINLVNNAIKFTEKGYVHTKVSLRGDNGNYFVRFDVEDTGIGIPEDRQAAVFESFTQADGSTTRQYGGTGLGLTVTKQLVELLGGELTLASEPGNGSIFSLVIPTGMDITGRPLLDRDNPLDHEEDDSPKADTTLFSGRVLVAEDVEGNQKLMTVMLSKLGIEVVIAEDGNQALQKALSQSFDLILMDMQMPHMNGYKATAALRQQGYKTPIVALTANAMTGDDKKCMDAGCDGYLTKPIDRRELPCILAKYLPTSQETTSQAMVSTHAQTHESEQLGSKRSSSEAQVCQSDDSDISAIINWDQLIERLGDEDIVREIMPIYIKDTQEHFEKLSQAVKSGDCAAIAAHAHALKGVGRNLSVDPLSDLACQMEQAGRDNDIEASTLLFNGLRTAIEKVIAVLSQSDWIEKAESA